MTDATFNVLLLAVPLAGGLVGYGLVEFVRWLERCQSERDLCPDCLGYHEWPTPEGSPCGRAQRERQL